MYKKPIRYKRFFGVNKNYEHIENIEKLFESFIREGWEIINYYEDEHNDYEIKYYCICKKINSNL